jgi:DNA-binding XRE family transcriptional regulator
MGGEGSGRKPDRQRRERAAQLRARGHTLAQIGRELGCGPGNVRHLLGLTDAPPPPPRCSRCHTPLGPASAGRDSAPALCLACLGKRPRAPLGQRLRAYRLAAGLTRAALSREANVRPETIAALEQGEQRPYRRTLRRLAKALGVGVPQLDPNRGT